MLTKVPVRICRKIGPASHGVVVWRQGSFLVVPRICDKLRLNVYGKNVEVTDVFMDPDNNTIDVFIKPDYRTYEGKDKDVLVAQYRRKGWHQLVEDE